MWGFSFIPRCAPSGATSASTRQELVMNTPLINPNDPKWTAYVLGELDEAERAAVERLLESSAEARALVEELTMASAAFQDSFDAEAAHVLTPAQRSAVRRAADGRQDRF